MKLTCYDGPDDVGDGDVEIEIQIDGLADGFVEHVHHGDDFVLDVRRYALVAHSEVAEVPHGESTLLLPQTSIGTGHT